MTDAEILRDLVRHVFYSNTWLRHAEVMQRAMVAVGYRISNRTDDLVDPSGNFVADPYGEDAA